jgi:hypothetical protein
MRPMVQFDQLQDAQLVIKTIPEDLVLKQKLFAELNRVCHPQMVLASNTSSTSITKLAGKHLGPTNGLLLSLSCPITTHSLSTQADRDPFPSALAVNRGDQFHVPSRWLVMTGA